MRRTAGFSLVELSIVLVILGLLVGGIMAGQSLIRAAQVRNVGTEVQRYTTALYAFRDKYNAIAGDFRDASRVWGHQLVHANCPTHSGQALNASLGACDGDGNMQVEWSDTARPTEAMQSWRQLALAGLIEGSYSGLKTAPFSEPGINTPVSKLPQGRWVFYYHRAQLGSANNYGGIEWRNQFTLSAADGVSGMLLPEEAWNIDMKLDDGKPGRGRINVLGREACDTSATPTDYDGAYDFAVKDRVCALRWGWVI